MIVRLAIAAASLLLAATAFAFDLQGHRGARGLAPENTLAAFELALEIGVDTLELDIGVSADGVVVTSHDPYLNPAITRDATGRWLPGARGPLVKSLTFAQLQGYDLGRIDPASPYAASFPRQQPRDGQRMPSLASLFALTKRLGANAVRFNIETKIDPTRPDDTVSPEAMVHALLETVRQAGVAQRVSIQSFDWRTLQLVQRLEPAIPTVYLSFQNATGSNAGDSRWTAGFRLADHGSIPRLVKAAGGAAWSPNFASLTQPLVKEAQALGLKVIPWTVNSAADMGRLIDWGVDGIISDYPDRLRETMGQRGMPLPRGTRQ